MSFLAQHFFHMFCFIMSIYQSPNLIILAWGTKTVWCSVTKFNLQFFVHWWAHSWEVWCQQSSFSVSGVECCLYWTSGIFQLASNWLISSLMGAALTIPKSVQIRLHAWCNDKLLSSGRGNVMLVCDMFSRLHMFPVSFSFVYFHVSQLFCIVHW